VVIVCVVLYFLKVLLLNSFVGWAIYFVWLFKHFMLSFTSFYGDGAKFYFFPIVVCMLGNTTHTFRLISFAVLSTVVCHIYPENNSTPLSALFSLVYYCLHSKLLSLILQVWS
jgi:hypothetical protein